MNSEKAMTNVKLLQGVFVAFFLSPIQASGQSYDQRVAHGSRLLREGKTKMALDVFLLAYRDNPNADLSLQIGRIYLHLKNPDKALHFCSQYLNHPQQKSGADTRYAKAHDCVQLAAELRRPGKESSALTDRSGHSSINREGALLPLDSGKLPVQHGHVEDKNPVQSPVDTRPAQEIDSIHGIALSGVRTSVVVQHRVWSDGTLAAVLGRTGSFIDRSIQDKPMGESSLRKRWWFWSLIGLGVSGAVAATAGGIVAAQKSRNGQSSQIMQEPFGDIPNDNVIEIKSSVFMLLY